MTNEAADAGGEIAHYPGDVWCMMHIYGTPGEPDARCPACRPSASNSAS